MSILNTTKTNGVEGVLPLTATDGVLRTELERLAEARRLQDAQQRLLGENNRTAVRPKDAAEAGIRRVDARVEVRPGVYPEGHPAGRAGDICIEVAVYSLMRPGAFKRVLVNRYAPTAEVQIAAGACAEECCEQFGDPFDPSQAADEAVERLAKLRA